MGITKDSIVSSVCGIDSKITLEDLSKHLEMDVEDLIEFEDGDLGDLEGTSELIENDGKLSFNWEGQEDHGITQLLKDVFNEEYLLQVDLDVVYEDTQESYIEIMIFDNKKEIVENVVRYDGEELTTEEKSVHDNRDEDYFYLKSYDVTFFKKSEFNKDNVEGQPVV
tara:strand:+ start:102 stop:602 length:501 start_codon:yes stop_codon:yes gene_type:complete